MQPSFILSLTGAATFLSSTAIAGPYSAYDISGVIPYLDQTNPAFSERLHVNLRVGSTTGAEFEPFIDTGSTGIVLPGKDIPGFSANDCTATSPNRGFHYLTSSNILYVGCWVTRGVYFNAERPDSTHPVIHSRVPILAVTSRIECHKDTNDVDVIATGDCTNKVSTTIGPSCHGTDPVCFGILGIGWGRLNDGQPQATSDKNPLINVVDMAVPRFDINRLSQGFIVTEKGLEVGLTEANTKGLDWTDLPEHPDQKPPPPPGSGGPRVTLNWDLLPACIWLDKEDPKTDNCQEVSALLDTGIPQSYFRTPTRSTYSMPPRDVATGEVDHGIKITVSFKKSSASAWHSVTPAETFSVGVFAAPPDDQHDVTPMWMHAYKKNGYLVTTFF